MKKLKISKIIRFFSICIILLIPKAKSLILSQEIYRLDLEKSIEIAKEKSHTMLILKQNLDGERCAISRYQEIANYTNGKDHVTHQMATQILNDELEHEQDIEDWINDIDKMKEDLKKLRM